MRKRAVHVLLLYADWRVLLQRKIEHSHGPSRAFTTCFVRFVALLESPRSSILPTSLRIAVVVLSYVHIYSDSLAVIANALDIPLHIAPDYALFAENPPPATEPASYPSALLAVRHYPFHSRQRCPHPHGIPMPPC